MISFKDVVVKNTVEKLIKGEDYREEVVNAINVEFLDFTSGSSTTAVACENTNRKWICIKKEDKYCEISKKRLEEKK